MAAAGNIGPTLLDTLAQALDAAAAAEPMPLPEVWVLELSSFQLDGVDGFEPDAATVLNVTQDHLDWHGTHGRLRRRQGAHLRRAARVMVINRDDPRVERHGAAAAGRPTRRARPRRRSRSRDAWCASAWTRRTRPGDFGLVVENGMAWLVRALPPTRRSSARKGEAARRSTCSA